MKIYKLDIDTSKPIRKVVQMQQNSTGALSVDVTNDGWPIRNLSCALYDGETELSAYAELSSGAGYKIDVGDETKVVKFTAKSVPNECSAQYVVSNTGPRTKHIFLEKLQLEAGTYRQDEFYGIARQADVFDGMAVWPIKADQLSNINIQYIAIMPEFTEQPVLFMGSETNKWLSKDEPIIVTGPVTFGKTTTVKTNAVISAYNYPAVGYWTDYSLDTVIRPSENAHCYAEQEVSDPTPDPEPEPDPDPTPDPDDPPAETTEGGE